MAYRAPRARVAWRFALAALVAVGCNDAPGEIAAAPVDQELEDDLAAEPADDDPAIGADGVSALPPAAAPPDSATGVDGGGGGDAAAVEAPPAIPDRRVDSPVPGYRVTYPFGVKSSRYIAGYHTGEDYASPTGTSVVAVRSGTIAWSNDRGGAYGKWMGLDADNGRTYVYCHLSARGLAAGAKVTAGQVIGKVGSTGNTTGPHLHFEDHPLGPFRYADVRKPAW